MNKKRLCRIVATLSASVICVGAVATFTGCTTNHPEVTITYEFNGATYAVDYTLSRSSAPQTVQHFIELADNGYYNGMAIHDYTTTAMYGGGYVYDESGALKEKDYFTAVKDMGLTQSVFSDAEGKNGLNTLYGEFSKNGVNITGEKNVHEKGALVMYYSAKGDYNGSVTVKTSGSEKLQGNNKYVYNSATSLFYTYLGEVDTNADANYCVFGKATDYDNQMVGTDGLITAINKYVGTLGEGGVFTEETTVGVNQFDPFEEVRNDHKKTTYKVPTKAIIIQSVEVTKY